MRPPPSVFPEAGTSRSRAETCGGYPESSVTITPETFVICAIPGGALDWIPAQGRNDVREWLSSLDSGSSPE